MSGIFPYSKGLDVETLVELNVTTKSGVCIQNECFVVSQTLYQFDEFVIHRYVDFAHENMRLI